MPLGLRVSHGGRNTRLSYANAKIIDDMSWSLRLQNGDLSTEGTKLGQVSGGQKLIQDLKCALLERRGLDDMHPSYGSLIDGGRDEFGREVPSLIGSVDWERAGIRVEGEIRRIATEYQARQVRRAENDRYRYGESTLSNSELLLSIQQISMTQAQDKLMVRVLLDTATGEQISIDVPISDTGII